jgi:hypothetical protein
MALPFEKNLKHIKIYLRLGSTSFNLGIPGLISLIENGMGIHMDDQSIFCFCSKSKKQIKIIYKENAGYFLIQRRIRYGTFPWPQDNEEAALVDYEILKALLVDPVAVDAIHTRHKVRKMQLQLAQY